MALDPPFVMSLHAAERLGLAGMCRPLRPYGLRRMWGIRWLGGENAKPFNDKLYHDPLTDGMTVPRLVCQVKKLVMPANAGIQVCQNVLDAASAGTT